MATLIPNDFSSYHLTDEEQIEGAILTITQKQVMQNCLASCASEKLSLDYDPEHPLIFAQQEAYKKGQIEVYQFLLDSSEAAEELKRNAQPPS